MTIFLQVIFYLILGVFILQIAKTIFIIAFSLLQQKKSKNNFKSNISDYKPLVSVLVPSYNEEKTLGNCLESLLKQTYENYEILIIDDGSKDNTAVIAQSFVDRYPGKIMIISKQNGGKASALNCGIEQAKGEIIISIDADSIFIEDTIANLTRHFIEPQIGAVGGNVKVANRSRGIARNQAIEYISGLQLEKRAFDFAGCIQVVPGAIGAFRKEALKKVGGYSLDTMVEDMDLTIAIGMAGYDVIYDNDAKAYTEAPENMTALYKQRFRWNFGTYQMYYKYSHLLFKYRGGRNGMLGLVGLPYFIFSQILQGLTFVLIILSLAMLPVYGGNNFIILGFIISIVYFLITVIYSLIIDKENKGLVRQVFALYFWYYHFISIVLITSFYAYLRNKPVGWQKLERTGRNSLLKTNPVQLDFSILYRKEENRILHKTLILANSLKKVTSFFF